MNTFVVRHIKTTLTLFGLSAIMLLLAIGNIPSIYAAPTNGEWESGDIVYEEDFEGASDDDQLGWVSDPYGTDEGTNGQWKAGNPEQTNPYRGNLYQLGNANSGANALITGLKAGNSTGAFDVDGDVSVLSPSITLPVLVGTHRLYLDFSAYFAHTKDGSENDFLRVTVLSEVGSDVIEFDTSSDSTNNPQTADQPAKWGRYRFDLTQFAGQEIELLIEAGDEGQGTIVEAGIDDIKIYLPHLR